MLPRGRGGAVPGIDLRHGAQQRGHILDRPADRARRVLAVGDGDDAAPADKSQCGLEADDAAGLRGADDGAVGFSSEGASAERCGDRRRGSGRRTAGGAVERIRIAGESASAGPTAHRVLSPPVGPLAQVGLAENNSPRIPEFPCQEGIARRPGPLERQRAGRGGHPIPRADVVFEKDGNSVQRASYFAGRPFSVALAGDGKGIRVKFDHGVNAGTGSVDGLNPPDVVFGYGDGSGFAGGHSR